MADGGAGSLQQPLESPGATIAKLRIKLADLQEEMVEKKIPAGDVQELLLIGMLKTLDILHKTFCRNRRVKCKYLAFHYMLNYRSSFQCNL